LINGGHLVEARIGLSPASAGGLHAPMPPESRSLLLKFPSLDSPDEQTTIGAAIETLDRAPC
jgi:hypothetical protein